MKKLLFIIKMFFFSSIIMAENKPIEINNLDYYLLDKLSDLGYVVLPEVQITASYNYQDTTKIKKKEIDDLYYQPSRDGKQIRHVRQQRLNNVIDTLVNENPNIKISYTTYNDIDPFFYSRNINRFYHGFNYWYDDWYYNNYMYNPWSYNNFMFYDWTWGYNYNFYGYHNNFYGYNFRYNNFYSYNNHNYSFGYGNHNYNQPKPQDIQYGHRERPSTMSGDYNRRNNQNINQQQKPMPKDRAAYQDSRRSYNPSYEKPRMEVKPQFNNTPNQDRRVMQERMNTMQQQRRGEMQNMPRMNNTEQQQRRTYSPPTNPNQQRSMNQQRPVNEQRSMPMENRRESYSNPGNVNNSNSAPNNSSGSINNSSGSRRR
jgi:hypothetical protein